MLPFYQDDLKIIHIEDDDVNLAKIRQDNDILKNLSEVYAHLQPMPSTQSFGIEKNGRLVGAIILKNIRWHNRKTEITIYISKEFQGQKIGQIALQQFIDYVFNHLNFHRIEAEVFSYNTSGMKLFEKSGFIREGILREARYYNGKYHDIIRFGLLKQDYMNK